VEKEVALAVRVWGAAVVAGRGRLRAGDAVVARSDGASGAATRPEQDPRGRHSPGAVDAYNATPPPGRSRPLPAVTGLQRTDRIARRSVERTAISGRVAAAAEHRQLARLFRWSNGNDLQAAPEYHMARWRAAHGGGF